MEEEKEINNVEDEESRVRNDSQSANDEGTIDIEEVNKPRDVAEFVNEEVEAEPKTLGAGQTTKPKPKKGCRPCKNGETPLRLRDKTNCPDCGKQISVHALNYSHSQVCKANKTKQSNIIIEDVIPKEETSSKTKELIEYRHIEPEPIDMHQQVLKYMNEMKFKEREAKQTRFRNMLRGKL